MRRVATVLFLVLALLGCSSDEDLPAQLNSQGYTVYFKALPSGEMVRVWRKLDAEKGVHVEVTLTGINSTSGVISSVSLVPNHTASFICQPLTANISGNIDNVLKVVKKTYGEVLSGTLKMTSVNDQAELRTDSLFCVTGG